MRLKKRALGGMMLNTAGTLIGNHIENINAQRINLEQGKDEVSSLKDTYINRNKQKISNFNNSISKSKGNSFYMANGGRMRNGLKPISKTANLVVGDKHGEDTDGDGQEGVQVGQYELEEGEVEQDGMVFSKKLGFADKALKVISSLAYKEYEKKRLELETILADKRGDMYAKGSAERNLEKLSNPLEQVFQEQETFKEVNGLNEEQQEQGEQQEMALGGEMKSYDKTYNPFNTKKSNSFKSSLPKFDSTATSSFTGLDSLGNGNVTIPKYNRFKKPNSFTYTKLGDTPMPENNSLGSSLDTPVNPEIPERMSRLNAAKSKLNKLGSNEVLQGVALRSFDNVVNAFNRTPTKLPKPRLLETTPEDVNMDVSPMLSNINTTTSARLKNNVRNFGVDAKSENQKAYVDKLKATNDVYARKELVESERRARNLSDLRNVKRTNLGILSNRDTQAYANKEAIRNSNMMQGANFQQDINSAIQDKNINESDRASMAMIVQTFNEGGVLDRKLKPIIDKYPEIFGKWEDMVKQGKARD